MRALVVDDSSTMRSILRLILRRRQFEVAEAKNGVDALEVLQKSERPDLMLVDWNMPEMNGLELVCRVRQDHQYDSTQIVMVTTETAMPELSQALTAGANEYIMKPFTADVVLEKLQVLGL